MDHHASYSRPPSLIVRLACGSVLTATIFISIISPAYATGSPMGDVLCDVLKTVMSLAAPLGTAAVLACGFAAATGKAPLGMGVTMAVGMVILIGAGTIATMVFGLPNICGA